MSDKLTEAFNEYFRSNTYLGINPIATKWENMANAPLMKAMAEQANLPILPNTYLLRKEYFAPLFQSRIYPYQDKIDTENLGGFAPYYGQLAGDKDFENFRDAIILNLDSGGARVGNLPAIYRHEVAHRQLPSIKGGRNYGYILPEGLQSFLSSYRPKDRGEELKAEMFAGRSDMPESIKKILRKKISEEISY